MIIIATRPLMLRRGTEDLAVPANFHAPIEADSCCERHCEIGWPEGRRQIVARGPDGVQALHLAMQRAVAPTMHGERATK